MRFWPHRLPPRDLGHVGALYLVCPQEVCDLPQPLLPFLQRSGRILLEKGGRGGGEEIG